MAVAILAALLLSSSIWQPIAPPPYVEVFDARQRGLN